MEEKKKGKDGATVIDLRELYQFEPGELQPDITHSSYSNLAYVQVTHRDVFIDFLEMPGIRRDDRMRVNGTRIYMSHAAAQKLAEALSGILDKVYKEEGMEKYVPESLTGTALSTKVKRKQEDRTI